MPDPALADRLTRRRDYALMLIALSLLAAFPALAGIAPAEFVVIDGDGKTHVVEPEPYEACFALPPEDVRAFSDCAMAEDWRNEMQRRAPRPSPEKPEER